MVRWLLVGVALLGVIACGDDAGESAEQAVRERIERLGRREYAVVWESLHPAHQEIVSQQQFVDCARFADRSRSPVVDEIRRVEDQGETTRTIPEIGEVDVRTVEAEIVQGGELRQPTFDVTEVDGEWRWVLNQEALDAFRNGSCPR